MRFVAALLSVGLLAGCVLPHDRAGITPDCGGLPDAELAVSIPETDEPVHRLEFMSGSMDFGLMCSIAWPESQNFDWAGGPEQTLTVLPDKISEIRIYRANSVVRLGATVEIAKGTLVLLPDWPAVLFNKKGVPVERSETLRGNPDLDAQGDGKQSLPFTTSAFETSITSVSGWNRGLQLRVDVYPPEATGFNVTLRLRSPSGDDVWTESVTTADGMGASIPIPELGIWDLLVSSHQSNAPADAVFSVYTLFRY